MTDAELSRASALLDAAGRSIINRLRKSHGYYHLHGSLEKDFERAIRRNCKMLIDAAAVKPKTHKEMSLRKEKEKANRKSAADQLRIARKQLRQINWQIANADKAAKAIVIPRATDIRRQWAARLRGAKARFRAIEEKMREVSSTWATIKTPEGAYPEIPEPMFTPTAEGLGLPMVAGIYFLFRDDEIEYVGQSVNLANRLRLGLHHVLTESHRISILPIHRRELTWAECYYIGATRSRLNFGLMASHLKS